MKKLFLFFLGILGITCSACVYTKYGCPYAEFEVKGKVTDQAGQPLKDIRVVVNRYDTTKTDSLGQYYKETQLMGAVTGMVPIEAVDMDGEANGGTFAPTTVYVNLTKKDFKDGDGDWYEGKAMKEVNFKLEKKETEK